MKYKKIVVAGGGVLGSQIAFQSAYCGFDVTILIRKEDPIDDLKEKLKVLYETYETTIKEMDKEGKTSVNWARGIADAESFNKEECLEKLKRAKEHLKLYKLNQNDVILASTPLYHSLAERLLIMSVISGATCVIIDDFKASEWFNVVNREKVTFTISEASQLCQITPLLLSPFVPDISSLKTIVSS